MHVHVCEIIVLIVKTPLKAVSISMKEREIYMQAYNKNQAGQEKKIRSSGPVS